MLCKLLWIILHRVVCLFFLSIWFKTSSLQWCHNEHDGISNHQLHNCLLKLLFRCGSKKPSKLHVTGLCAGNSPVTSELLKQRASNAENVSIWWHHHDVTSLSRRINSVCAIAQKALNGLFPNLAHTSVVIVPELINFSLSWVGGQGHSIRKSD